MSNSKFPRPTAPEQHILEHLTVRPITPQERRRFDALMVEHHYLKSHHLVGEQLCYVATYQGQWLALSSWCAAARHLKRRDQFIEQLWVKSLVKNGSDKLRAQSLPEAWA